MIDRRLHRADVLAPQLLTHRGDGAVLARRQQLHKLLIAISEVLRKRRILLDILGLQPLHDAAVRMQPRDPCPPPGPSHRHVVLRLKLHALLRTQPAQQRPGAVLVFGCRGNRIGPPAHPAHRRMARTSPRFRDRRRGNAESQILSEVCDHIHERIAIDAHRDMAGQERINHAAACAGLERPRHLHAAERIIHVRQILKGVDNLSTVERARQAVDAHESGAIQPPIHVEPTVTEQGNAPDRPQHARLRIVARHASQVAVLVEHLDFARPDELKRNVLSIRRLLARQVHLQ